MEQVPVFEASTDVSSEVIHILEKIISVWEKDSLPIELPDDFTFDIKRVIIEGGINTYPMQSIVQYGMVMVKDYLLSKRGRKIKKRIILEIAYYILALGGEHENGTAFIEGLYLVCASSMFSAGEFAYCMSYAGQLRMSPGMKDGPGDRVLVDLVNELIPCTCLPLTEVQRKTS